MSVREAYFILVHDAVVASQALQPCSFPPGKEILDGGFAPNPLSANKTSSV